MLCVIVTIGLAAAGIVFFLSEGGRPSDQHLDPAQYFGFPEENEKTIVTSDEILPNKGIADYNTVYILFEDAKKGINPRMYYDESADILTVTTPDKIINITPDDTMTEGAECARKIDGSLYVAASFLASVSDIEVSPVTEAPQVMIRTSFDEPETAAAEACPIRLHADIKSPIIRDLAQGETVTVIGEDEEWTYVRTADGFIGYVLTVSLGSKTAPAPHESPLTAYTSLRVPFSVNMVFHQTDSQASNAALEKALEGTHGINIIAPTWFFMDDTAGSFTDLTSSEYVEKAHSLGMQVWAVANDFDGGIAAPSDTSKLLASTPVRQTLAENLVEAVLGVGADGLNLDFENVREDSSESYLMLIRELSVLCRKEGIFLSADSYVPQLYNAYLNRAAQAEVMDYIVTMAYDEHFAGSDEAGSVSSLSWVGQAVTGTLEEVPAEKLIIALPFYTRIWETSAAGGKPTSRAAGMREAESQAASLGMKIIWDDKTGQEYGEVTQGNKIQIWFENERSFKKKLELLKDYPIAGTAAWKLGLEVPGIWDLLSEYHGV